MTSLEKRVQCAVCDSFLSDPVVSLPNLPIGMDIFKCGQDRKEEKGIDQHFHLCSTCGHGQLSVLLDPVTMYGQNYGFRTSRSERAAQGAATVIMFLERILPKRSFYAIADIGCNDLYLLRQLKRKAKKFYGVDPLWKSREFVPDNGVTLIPKMAEDVTKEDFRGDRLDLIISTHTVEHVRDPKTMLLNIISCADDEAVFIFEFPCLEIMLRDLRFDRIFHQHLQYFTLYSFITLLNNVGMRFLACEKNETHWGSLIVAFQKTKHQGEKNFQEKCLLSNAQIKKKYACFQDGMRKTAEILEQIEIGGLFGYGASIMVPILFYHLGIDEERLSIIFDDNCLKDGFYYPGLNVMIKAPVDRKMIKGKSLLITALDHIRAISQRALELDPGKVIVPFGISF